MPEGTIKYYNSEQGFGLIKRADGERDIRFLFDALVKGGVSSASAGQKVRFEVSVDPVSNKVTADTLKFN